MSINTDQEIFNQRIFGGKKNRELMRRGLSLDESPEIAQSVWATKISCFDYILGHKRGIIPVHSTNGEAVIYCDGLEYRRCGITTANGIMEKEGTTVRDFINIAVVHGGIFLGLDRIDIGGIYLGLLLPPEDYSICCMQWDAYGNLFMFIAWRLERGVSRFTCEWVTSATNRFYNRRISKMYISNPNPNTRYLKPEAEWDANRDSRISSVYYAEFTSDLGKVDWYNGNCQSGSPGIYADQGRDGVLTPWRLSHENHPGCLPDHICGPSFFSDAYSYIATMVTEAEPAEMD